MWSHFGGTTCRMLKVNIAARYSTLFYFNCYHNMFIFGCLLDVFVLNYRWLHFSIVIACALSLL